MYLHVYIQYPNRVVFRPLEAFFPWDFLCLVAHASLISIQDLHKARPAICMPVQYTLHCYKYQHVQLLDPRNVHNILARILCTFLDWIYD